MAATAAKRRLEVLLSHVVGSDAAATSVPSRTAGAGAGAGAGAIAADGTACFRDEFSAVPIRDAYDYVIVGGGTAGCVMAARLSEDPAVSVLLLEAGGDGDTDMDVTIAGRLVDLQRSAKDWQFESKTGPELNNRDLFVPRGKVLGGCSSINAVAYVRGHPENFNGWARTGCDGWSYEEVLPYFKKLEDCGLKGASRKYRGKGGPVHCVSPAEVDGVNQMTDVWLAACVEAGMKMSDDYNGEDFSTFGMVQSNTDNGWRGSMAASYLRGPRSAGNGDTGAASAAGTPPGPAINRGNLTVATQVHVTKVVFQGKRAVGVTYKRGSTDVATVRGMPTQVVSAKREVILCAGAICSPWLLMLSGVGPAAHLREHGIEVVADLPVGKNLQDHLMAPMWWPTTDAASPVTATMTPAKAKAMAKFLFLGKGEGMVSPLQGTGFLHSSEEPHSDDGAPGAPDIQMHMTPFVGGEEFLVKSNFLNTGHHTRAENMPLYGFSMLPILLRPQSRGTVTLRSSSPLEYPEIKFNFLTRERDVKVLVEGMRLARRIAGQAAYKGMIHKECIDKDIDADPESDEYLREYIKRTTLTVYHPVGTCRMGDPREVTTVVDPRCRVVGVRGLRVVDAAAMPFVISGNTCIPVVMMAEKAADMIKEDA